MWIYGLGETLKRATLTSHAATSRLSGELCQVLAGMTKPQAGSRASLMHLLDVSNFVFRHFDFRFTVKIYISIICLYVFYV